MPSRYQFGLLDLFPLIFLWPPCIAGTYTYIGDPVFHAPFWTIIVSELLVSATLLSGWSLGLKIANSLGYTNGWKRLVIVLLGWFFIPSVFVCLSAVFIFIVLVHNMLDKDGFIDGSSFAIPGAILIVSIAIVWYTWQLNRRADLDWKQREEIQE